MPHDDKHYQKLQRTFKFVFDALWLVALVLIVGLNATSRVFQA